MWIAITSLIAALFIILVLMFGIVIALIVTAIAIVCVLAVMLFGLWLIVVAIARVERHEQMNAEAYRG